MYQRVPLERIAGLGDSGLDVDAVLARRARFGPNEMLPRDLPGWRGVLRDSARDPMLWFLVACAGLFAGLGETGEAIVLALALLPLLGMDAYLHRRTQASTASLAGALSLRVPARRAGRMVDVAASDLVPGDLVRIDASAAFPADGLIIAGEDLQVDESSLTGEAMPVRKQSFSAELAGEGERPFPTRHWASAGTRLLTGTAWQRVVFTGAETTYGQIVRLARAESARTPLQQAIGALVARLVVVAGLLCVALAIARYLQGHGLVDALLSSATLAVAALPEEFPVVFTFFLGVGVYRMARRQALVRRAAVVEGIGRVTCLCTDKTGTLTEGRLRLAHRQAALGQGPDRLLQVAATAARADSLDPLDQALLEASAPLDGDRIATFPFTEDRRRETAVLRRGDGRLQVSTKGAPEQVLRLCELDADSRAAWQARVDALAADGHKVIACAQLGLPRWDGDEPDRGFEFLGLLAFEDPLRAGVVEAVAQARAAGIRVIMVTGDHPGTAAAIAREAGIGGLAPGLIEGEALAARLREGDLPGLATVDVVARALPAQKSALVQALRAAGEVVAVTGDGVNDVPALQGADIGIAMGSRASRSAREAAAIVLLDDNVGTLVRAVAEGRQLFRNLRLSFAYLLVIHLPLVLTAALVPFAGLPLLYLPAHIVWLELIIHPTALLVFQQQPRGDALQPGPSPGVRFFSPREWILILASGLAIALAVLVAYAVGLQQETATGHARALALAVLIAAGAATTLALAGSDSRPARVAALAGLASVLMLTQVDAVARLLHLSALSAWEWLLCLAVAAAAASPMSLLRRGLGR